MKICKNICLFSLYALYAAVFFAICFLLNAPLFVFKGLVLLLCVLALLVWIWGDKIILAVVKAQKLFRTQIDVHESYRGRIENMACLMGLGQIDIYRSKALPPDIYVLRGAGGVSCFIVGGDVFAHLSEQERDALIYFSILKIKKLNLNLIQGCNFFFFLASLPTMFLKKFKFLKFVGLVMDFFLLPLEALKRFVFKENNNYLKGFMEELEMGDMENTIETAFFKLRHLPTKYSNEASSILLADLSAVEKDL